MHRLLGAAIVGSAFTLGACASNSYCLGEQDYQKAPSVPAIEPVDGLKVPQSQSALTIPPPPQKTEPFGKEVKNKDGDNETLCLDQPPKMPEPAEKPAETDKALPPPPNPTKPGEPVAPPAATPPAGAQPKASNPGKS